MLHSVVAVFGRVSLVRSAGLTILICEASRNNDVINGEETATIVTQNGSIAYPLSPSSWELTYVHVLVRTYTDIPVGSGTKNRSGNGMQISQLIW